MKKKIMFTTLMAFIAIAMFAQSQDNRPAPGGGGDRPKMSAEDKAKHSTDKLSEVVKLTPDQYTKVLAINKNFIEQRNALRGADQKPSDEAREKSKALNKQKEEQIKAVLTADQQKKWEANRKEEHANGGGDRPHGE